MRNYSVMIIDDNEMDRYILKRLLKKTSLVQTIFEAQNGKEALDFIQNYEENKAKNPQEFPPLVIFLDINMPLVNGFEFLEKYTQVKKDTADLEHTVIMMFSSSERQKDKDKAFSFDFVKDFISKGNIDAEELKNKIRGCIAA